MKKFKLKKKRYRPQKVYSFKKMLRMFIDAELRPFGVKMSDIEGEENGIINGQKWFEYYKFYTKSQEEVWKEYCSKIYRRHACSWYTPKSVFDRQFSWFSLQYGLTSDWYIKQMNNNLNKENNEDTSNS